MKIAKKIFSISMMLMMLVLLHSTNVYAAGSFSVSGGGSVSAGGSKTITITASDCAGVFSVSASGGGTVSSSSVWLDCSSSSVTVTAPSSGSTTITVTASDVTDYDGNGVSGSKTATVTVKETTSDSSSNSSSNNSSSNASSNSSSSDSSSNNNTTVEEEEPKSSNNKLSALTVSEGELSPAFDASTTEYSVNVVDIETITIEATKADSTASISGTGEKELEPGMNEFSVVVTAEDGSTKTYNIGVTLTETPSVYISYGEAEFGIVKNVSELQVPDGFEEVSITVEGEEVTAWTNNTLGLTLLYLIDADGVEAFYIYNEDGTIQAFRQLGLLGKTIYVLDISEEEQLRDGMIYQAVTISGEEIMGWAFEDEALSDYFIIYVMNDMGQMVEYLYCASENAMILAPNMAPVSSDTYAELIASNNALSEKAEEALTENATLYYYIQIVCIVAAVLLAIVLLLLILLILNKRKMKKLKIAQNNSNQQTEEYIEPTTTKDVVEQNIDINKEETAEVVTKEYEVFDLD